MMPWLHPGYIVIGGPWPPSFSLEQVYADTLGRPGSVVSGMVPFRLEVH